eukprot:TRINITY_DN29420_c0_g1_i1.p1 TRINITY_DN29420_c0_g1~~TRINITY_DN29420_c0_g1_i1.p1  ORF type:complete len:207 (-),score=7.79 TRINITY_DN29420_c0_g1_i1:5-625(-)
MFSADDIKRFKCVMTLGQLNSFRRNLTNYGQKFARYSIKDFKISTDNSQILTLSSGKTSNRLRYQNVKFLNFCIPVVYKSSMPDDSSFVLNETNLFYEGISVIREIISESTLTKNLAIFKDSKRVASIEYLKPNKILDKFASLSDPIKHEALEYVTKLLQLEPYSKTKLSDRSNELAWRTIFNLNTQTMKPRQFINSINPFPCTLR